MILSPSSTDKKFLAAVFLLFFPLYLTWTFDHGLWNPDETRDAGIAREMYDSKDFVVPKLNGEPFLEKPPLYYWSTALVYAVSGRITAGTTRLPAALYGFLGVLFTFFIGKACANARVGFMAAAMVATSLQYFRMSHFALMDTALAALITGALYFHISRRYLFFLLCMVVAFFAKGFVGLALPGLVIAIDFLWDRKPKTLLALIVTGGLFQAVVTYPWVHGLWKSGGTEFLKTFFIHNNWERFVSSSADHQAPFYYYLGSFPVDFLPWTPFFIGALRNKFKDAPRFIRLWFIAMFLFLSLATSKRSMYLLPLFPAAAVLSAAWYDRRYVVKKNRWGPFAPVLAAWICVIVAADIFFVKKLDDRKSFVPIVQAVEEHRAGAEVIGFDLSEMERGVFPFYLKENIPNFTTVPALDLYLREKKGKRILLLTNKNKLTDLTPLVDHDLRLIYSFRPDEKTRSYLVYENAAQKEN